MLTFPTTITPQDNRAGRMIAAGSLTATVTSHATGQHITVKFRCIADNREREYDSNSKKNWITCPLADATHVFTEVPGASGEWADKIGTFYPKPQRWHADPKADPAREYAAAMVARWINGETFASTIQEEERCGVCSRPLTDPVSIERGIGPECYGRLTGSTHQAKVKTITHHDIDPSRPPLEIEVPQPIPAGHARDEVDRDVPTPGPSPMGADRWNRDEDPSLQAAFEVIEALPVAGVSRQAAMGIACGAASAPELNGYAQVLLERVDTVYAAHAKEAREVAENAEATDDARRHAKDELEFLER